MINCHSTFLDAFCLASIDSNGIMLNQSPSPQPTVRDLTGDGIFWAVPKHRRTIEKRLQRKFGIEGKVWKLLRPRTYLRVCPSCGNHYEVGTLCAGCYKKVKEETELIQEKIQKELKLDPVENEVVILYDGEKNEQPAEFWKGKRVVEMEKTRPNWFGKNLLQKSTTQPAESKDVKPDSLG